MSKHSLEFGKESDVFLKAKIIAKENSSLFGVYNIQTIKANNFQIKYKFYNSFQAKPLFVFKNSFKLIENRTDLVFEYFEDDVFITENAKFLLDTFNNYFYFFYNLNTNKEPTLLFRFLKFLKEKEVSDMKSFQAVFRDFNGDNNG